MGIQMGEKITMEQAAVKAEAQARHYAFIEKMAALMHEYNVEITGNMDGEINVWTSHGGEINFSDFGTSVMAKDFEEQMRFKEFNVQTVERIFNNYDRWHNEYQARAARRANQEQSS